MPRQKEFDPDRALTDAMQLFWEKGYEATSVQDLVDRMGINRFSIYDTFGGKHDLFLQALGHYRDTMGSTIVADLADSEEGIGAIKAYFATVIDHLTSPDGQKACLLINSIAERAGEDREVRYSCMENVDMLEGAFRLAVGRAQQHGEIGSDRDAGALAEYLSTSAMGLNVLGKTRPTRARLERSVEIILGSL